jgi:LPS-assembly lipoprotein
MSAHNGPQPGLAARSAASGVGRRRLIGGLGALSLRLGLAASLGGCGFQLQNRSRRLRQSELTVTGLDERDPLLRALRDALDGDIRLVGMPSARSPLALAVEGVSRQEMAASRTAAYLVRSVRVTVTVRFRIVNAAGEALRPTSAITQQRDISYDEGVALSKAQELQDVQRAMEAEAARQIVQQLVTLDR